MSPVAQVPSHTPLLIDKFLDMISDNKMGHRIPTGLHFKDKSGDFLFHARVAPYLQGCTARINANVLTPHGGGAGSNNATESQNKIAHKQMPTRKPPVAHVGDLLSHMHTVSMADTAFSDGMRRDIWHHDMMIAVAILMKWQPYPACPTCIFNLAGCTFRENVYIESLDPAQMRYAPSAAGGRQDRVVDFRTAMTSAPQQCIVMPTFKTMMTVIQNYPAVFQTHKAMTNTDREKLIKNFLSAPTQKPKVGPSWLSLFLGLFNVRSELALEDVTLTEWYDVVHSFALMPPLTDKDSVARYLGRLEKGIPIRDKTSTRLGNGCQVHWDQVPHTGIYYCLCPDHLLRGICLHVMLWLVSKGIVSMPPKWSASTIAGPSIKGRDKHYLAGSALMRDPPPQSQPSKHSFVKMLKSSQDPRSHHHTTQALIACMGTINPGNDSVRKYTDDKYKHGPDKYKVRAKKKAKGHDTNLSKQSQQRHTCTLRSIPETEMSYDDSQSESGLSSTLKKRKKRGTKEGTRAKHSSRDSDEESVSSTEFLRPKMEEGGQKTAGTRKRAVQRKASGKHGDDRQPAGQRGTKAGTKEEHASGGGFGAACQLSEPCSSKSVGKDTTSPASQTLGGRSRGQNKVCVCVCVYMCVCAVCVLVYIYYIYICMYVNIYGIHICMHVNNNIYRPTSTSELHLMESNCPENLRPPSTSKYWAWRQYPTLTRCPSCV